MANLNTIDVNLRLALRALTLFIRCEGQQGSKLDNETYAHIVNAVTQSISEREPYYIELYALLFTLDQAFANSDDGHEVELGSRKMIAVPAEAFAVLGQMLERFRNLCVGFDFDPELVEFVRERIEPTESDGELDK